MTEKLCRDHLLIYAHKGGPMTPEMQKKLYESFNPLERVQYLLEMRHYDMESGCDAHVELFNHALPELMAHVEVLVEALKFYADSTRYDASDIIDGVEVMEISNDQGERAREALKGWE